MAITKQRKDELLSQYESWLQGSKALIMTEYRGLSVKDMERLRDEVRKVGGVFTVTKNTLLELALQNTDNPIPKDFMNGQMAGGFALEEVPSLAKALVDFADKDEFFAIRGAVMGGKFLNANQVEALAKLPSLDQLRAQILGVVSAPARNLATTVSAGVRQVVNVIDAYARLEEEAETAAETS